LRQPPALGHWIIEVGRPSGEKSGGALLHAESTEIVAKIGKSANNRDASTLASFIPNPFSSCFY
jgi:hypothetical protein